MPRTDRAALIAQLREWPYRGDKTRDGFRDTIELMERAAKALEEQDGIGGAITARDLWLARNSRKIEEVLSYATGAVAHISDDGRRDVAHARVEALREIGDRFRSIVMRGRPDA